MNTRIRLIISILTVAPVCASLRAADPQSPPRTGHALLLDNERVLQGDIEHIGDQYRIKRSVGETWVPAERALRLCADVADAYAFLRGQANLKDPDERLRLAKWCYLQGLRKEALAELSAVATLRPGDAEAQRLLRRLNQADASPVADAPGSPGGVGEPGAPATGVTPPIEVSSESMNQFSTRIQPILMNACANCHVSGQAGAFKLIRTHEHGSLTPRTTQHNLTAVLAQVNLEQPHNSPLLTKAASIHGTMAQAPLSGRKMAAYRALEEWVKLTATKNAEPREQPIQAASEEPAKPNKSPSPKTEKPIPPAKPEDAVPEKTTTKEPADPFDPVIFNRESHPDH